MKQNRNLRPSKRAKFKGNNRETLYTEENPEDKPKFKEFSEFQVKNTINKFKEESKSQRRFELIVIIVFLGIIAVFLSYNILTKKESPKISKVKESRFNYNFTPLIIWSGKLYEPLRIANTDNFYIPMVGNLDYFDLDRAYKIYESNMVVKYTSNILFLDKNCDIVNKLLPENGSIQYMDVIPRSEAYEPVKIIYSLTQDEPNFFGKEYNLQKHFLYISDLDGKNLTRITDRKVSNYKWDNERKEILFHFFHNKRKNDSLYGIFNIESNKFKLMSQNQKSQDFQNQVYLNQKISNNPWNVKP